MKRHRRVNLADRKRVCREIMRMNLHPQNLFGKKMIMVLEKEYGLHEVH